jgi:hypothetical protein
MQQPSRDGTEVNVAVGVKALIRKVSGAAFSLMCVTQPCADLTMGGATNA